MKSIISVIMTAVLLLSVLTACGTNRTGNVEEVRVTPGSTAQATNSPSATNAPNGTDRDNTVGNAVDDVGDAAGSVVGGAADAVGDVVDGVGDAVDDAANGVGNAVDDMTDDARTGEEGRVRDNDGLIGNER